MTSPVTTAMDDNVYYLDNNATTPIDPRVFEAMEPFLRTQFGNPASKHAVGAAAHRAVEDAREQVAGLIGARSREIVFTSGATESNNLAIFGTLSARWGGIVAATTEHKSVLDPLSKLAEKGAPVTLVSPSPLGVVEPEAINDAIGEQTVLATVMAANNEIGTTPALAAVAALCRAKGVTFHSDGAQLVGKLSIDIDEVGVDLLSMSAHKLYGPKGIGALYVRRGTAIEPIILGGGHEEGLRSGTLNVPAIVGFGRAAEIARAEMKTDQENAEALRSLLLSELVAAFPELEVNGDAGNRLPGTLNVRLPGVDAEELLMAAPEVAASTGSACTSATPEPSHVLLAIGLSWSSAQECVRFGVGRFTTSDEVRSAVRALRTAATRLASDRARSA